jgi:hypothetical protein
MTYGLSRNLKFAVEAFVEGGNLLEVLACTTSTQRKLLTTLPGVSKEAAK